MNKKRFIFLFNILLIILFAIFTTYFTNRAGYQALNGDGYAHATKIKFLVDYWPNINWFYFWGNGIPVFLWYPIMPYVFLVFFYKIFSSAAVSIDIVNVITFIFIGIGIFGIVYETTKNRLASLLAAFLTIPLPGLWYRIQVGTTPRTLGDGFMMLSIWFLIKTLREKTEGSFKPLTIFGLIIFTSLAFQSHSFTTLMTIFFGSVIILFVASGLGEKIKFLFLTFLPALLISSYTLLPLIFTQNESSVANSFGLFSTDPMDLKLLFYHDPKYIIAIGGGLLPIHLPLLLYFTFIGIVFKKFQRQVFSRRVFVAFSTLFLFFMAIGSAIFFGFPRTWYSTTFVPDETFEFLSLIIPVLLGILFGLVILKRWLKIIFYPSIIISIILLIIWQYPLRFPLQPAIPEEKDAHFVYDPVPMKQALANFGNEKNYRFAHPATEFSLFFNFESGIPQNREFFPYGVLYPNWRSWQENAIWNPKWDSRMAETKFLLDWYSIRWFSLMPNFNLNVDKYQNDKDFKIAASNPDTGSYIFESKESAPILSLSNSPPVLVIGDKKDDRAYSPITRVLATMNFNSQVLILIRGKTTLDQYSANELAKFPIVILYEYHLNNPSQAGKMLTDYLNQGGHAIIESTHFVSEDNLKVFEKSLGFISNPKEAKGGNWAFAVPENEFTKGINFDKFSPPLYEGSPWKMSVVTKDSLGSKQPVLFSAGDVPIFFQQVGQGKLIWSGLNLPYHIQSNQNTEEAKFFTGLILKMLNIDGQPQPRPQSAVAFINPQKRTVEIQSEAKGVLFKENYFFNWHAKLTKDNQTTDLPVDPAGLDFMYIPFDKTISSGLVTIYYEKSWLEKSFIAISVISFLALIGLTIYFLRGGSKKYLNMMNFFSRISFAKISTWWQKDNEE